MTLDKMKDGETKVIISVNGKGAIRHRLLEMGILPNVKITLVKKAPFGDPIEIEIRGYELSLRLKEATLIEVGD